MLPFEFTVEGPPLSHQTKNKDRLAEWQNAVADAARQRWPVGVPPVAANVRLCVVYYHNGPKVRRDNDNMVKPIQDALNKLVYEDDSQITDTDVRKTSFDQPFFVRGIPSVLAMAFSAGKEFLHIRIEAAPDHAEIRT